MERNSEMKMLWVIIAIIGSQLLGINIGEAITLLNLVVGGGIMDPDVAIPALKTSQTAASNGSPLAMVGLTGLYTWYRSKIKLKRMELDQTKVASAVENGAV